MSDLKFFRTRFNLLVYIPTRTDYEGRLKWKSSLDSYPELSLEDLKKRVITELQDHDDKEPEFYITCIDPETKVLVQITSDFYHTYEDGNRRSCSIWTHRVRELDRWEVEQIEDHEVYQDREREYQSVFGDMFYDIEQDLAEIKRKKEEEEWKKGEAQRKAYAEQEEKRMKELYETLKKRFEK